MVAVLKQCGDNLTRENVMKQAASIDDLKLPMLLPGITVSTSADDFCPDKADATAKIRRHYLETVRRGDLGVRQLAIYAGRFELRPRRVDKKVFEEELPLRLLRGANGTPMAPRVDQRLQEELVRFEGWVLAKPEWLPGRLLVQLRLGRVGLESPTLCHRRRRSRLGRLGLESPMARSPLCLRRCGPRLGRRLGLGRWLGLEAWLGVVIDNLKAAGRSHRPVLASWCRAR
jgi:hypothetical protein